MLRVNNYSKQQCWKRTRVRQLLRLHGTPSATATWEARRSITNQTNNQTDYSLFQKFLQQERLFRRYSNVSSRQTLTDSCGLVLAASNQSSWQEHPSLEKETRNGVNALRQYPLYGTQGSETEYELRWRNAIEYMCQS